MTRAKTDKYGLTARQKQKLFSMQGGKCPVCTRPLYKKGNPQGKRASPVDHDHTTGRVRGILCYRCNRFRVSRNTAESAKRLYDYLASDFDARNL